ncbi:MAG: capsule assembly Wzi family protein [Longimicrobiaceae bacterium]
MPVATRPFLALAAAALVVAAPLRAQQSPVDLRSEATAGSEAERYLRVLQVAGVAPLYPWSIRAFSPAEVDRLASGTAAHPWALRLPPPADPGRRVHGGLLRPALRTVYNTAFPQGGNDGAVWAGRGATLSATAGVALRWGALSVRLEPVVFWTQNRSFALAPNGQPDSLRFSDPGNPLSIDLPQRFGDGGYGRVDPGQSTARLDVRGFALGVSTANQQWGPTVDLPLLLGTNAAGFPHAFLGTSTPWNVGVGRLHGRVVWGSLSQSPYSSVSGAGSRRLMTGVLGVFTPRGLPGLEVGGARFFHTDWPEGGLRFSDLTEPFQSLFKAGLPETGEGPDDRSSDDNQLASAFARWVLPRAGFEAWAEYAREDHNWDLKDFLLQPDHDAAYTLGARKVWRRGASLVSLRGEVLDAMPGNLSAVRRQTLFYRHTFERQGHTELGQVLGSPAAYGGAGSVVALEKYTPRGRWTVDWTRTRVRGLRATPHDSLGTGGVDVVHSLGAEAVLFRGGLDAVLGVRGSYELNRNGGDDAFNLGATLGLRIGLQGGPRPAAVQRVESVALDAAVDSAAAAPAADIPAAHRPVRALVTVGSRVEEGLRDRQLRGTVSDAGWLLRSPSSLTPWEAVRGAARIVAPEISFGWSSRIPVARNDGALRAGRGAGTLAMTGVMLQAGPFRLVAAPEIAWEENRSFDDLLPPEWTAEQRASFRPPWLTGRNSADLPYRFGGASRTRILPGESSLTLRAGALSLGAATEEQWWGPGVRNAILFTNQAAGVPHLFARTTRPLRTPLGGVEMKWVAGGLQRSEWAADSLAEWRSLSAFGLVLHPAAGLSVGGARAVYADADGPGDALSRAGDAFARWRGAGDSLAAHPFEQMTSLFGRWVFPAQGAEIYAEWARYRLPSLRQLLEKPEHTQGYVLGMQWLRPAGNGAVRLGTELAFLERSPAFAASPQGSWYASAAVPGGYTNRGEPVGALVGPGASGQWLAADWLRGDGRVGVFLGRNRWANDAFYDTPERRISNYRGHDVSVYGGARAAFALGAFGVDGEYRLERRMNYLFQNTSTGWEFRDLAVNVVNHSFQLRISARP